MLSVSQFMTPVATVVRPSQQAARRLDRLGAAGAGLRPMPECAHATPRSVHVVSLQACQSKTTSERNRSSCGLEQLSQRFCPPSAGMNAGRHLNQQRGSLYRPQIRTDVPHILVAACQPVSTRTYPASRMLLFSSGRANRHSHCHPFGAAIRTNPTIWGKDVLDAVYDYDGQGHNVASVDYVIMHPAHWPGDVLPRGTQLSLGAYNGLPLPPVVYQTYNLQPGGKLKDARTAKLQYYRDGGGSTADKREKRVKLCWR